MPTPDDYDYEPGQRPYYTPAVYRPPRNPPPPTYAPMPGTGQVLGPGDYLMPGHGGVIGNATPSAQPAAAPGPPTPLVPPQVAAIPRPPVTPNYTAPTLYGGANWEGEQPEFRERVGQLLDAMPPELRSQVAVNQGFRTYQQQQDLWNKHLRGEIGRTARPGHSEHERGDAADWQWKSPAAKQWMYANAGRFGLNFPFPGDDAGHMQLAQLAAQVIKPADALTPSPYQPQIQRYANEYGVPAGLLNLLIGAESNHQEGAISGHGNIGLGQLDPRTAQSLAVNPYNPDQNIQGAARYLRDMYNRTAGPDGVGSWSKAVAAYNAGFQGAQKNDFSLDAYKGNPRGQALIAAAAALDKNLTKAGPLVPPPQNYRPVSYTPRGGYPSMIPDRPPSMWGRDEPSMFEGPGSIPHQREIPGILQGLAPFLMIGLALFSKGAALPMLSGFSGYMKARAARQEKDAKELKTFYQDKLKETKAKLGLEQGDAAAAMAMPPGPQRADPRHRNALENGDPQLMAIVQQGGDPTALFQQRDKAYQDISKTAAAELAERREELAERREDRTADYQNAMLELAEKRGTEGEAAAKQKADKAKAALDKAKADQAAAARGGYPHPEAVGPGTDSEEKSDGQDGGGGGEDGGGTGGGGSDSGGDTGEQGAATPPASPTDTASAAPSPAATPASAPAAPQQAAAPDTGRDQIVDAQGNPIQPRADIQPAVYRGGAPTAQPAADTTGGGEQAPPEVPGVPRTPYEGHVSEALNGTEYNQLGVDKRLIPQISDGVVAKRAEIDSLPASSDYLDKLRAIDKPFGDFVDQLSNYNAPLPSTRGINGRAYFNQAMAAARKANPNWSYQNFKRQEEFADQKGIVQTRLTRGNTMAEAAGNIARDLKVLQEKYSPNRIREALQNFEATNFAGKEDFTDLVSNLKSFTQEDQALKTGTATVTETEAQQAIVAPPLFVGTPEQIRGYVKANIGLAGAVIDGFQERWTTDADGKTRMPGRNDHADAVIAAMPYWNSQTGDFPNRPPGVGLPPILANSIPHNGFPTPPADAVTQLKGNPTDEMKKHFDEIFGPDAAKHALGQ